MAHLREGGGIGRRTGFRFQRARPVGVQVPPLAPSLIRVHTVYLHGAYMS